MRECRSQIRVSPFGRRSWSRGLCNNNFFSPPSTYHRQRPYVPTRAESSVRWPFSCRGQSSAALAHCVQTCQLFCILAPHRLGGPAGRPGRLGTDVPSVPTAEQYDARHAEGGCLFNSGMRNGAPLKGARFGRCMRRWCWASALLRCFAIPCQVS